MIREEAGTLFHRIMRLLEQLRDDNARLGRELGSLSEVDLESVDSSATWLEVKAESFAAGLKRNAQELMVKEWTT